MRFKYLKEFMEESKHVNPKLVSFIPSYSAIGRNVVWCPYLNEPAFLNVYDGALDCPNCAHNYDPSSHPFICRIHKP